MFYVLAAEVRTGMKDQEDVAPKMFSVLVVEIIGTILPSDYTS